MIIVRLVAHHIDAEIRGDRPRVSAETPEAGECFEGLLAVAMAPTFAVPKPAITVFTLDD
jgi:type IV secretion system protein VirB11